MRATFASTLFADRLRRVVAGGCVALVLALSVFAASPELHEHLHEATDTTHDESCPIVLFANGANVPLAARAAPIPLPTAHQLAPFHAREIFLSSPRYLRQPERGPPSV